MAVTTETKVLLGVLVGTILLISIGAWLTGAKNTAAQDTKITPIAKTEHLFRDDDPVLGDAQAPVTVVEFSDYKCSACAVLHTVLKQVKQNTDPAQVRYIYRQFPLGSQAFDQLAAEASLTAGAQGKFWEYHDLLFEHQGSWSTTEDFASLAGQLDLDIDAFNKALTAGDYRDAVNQDKADGISIGINSTPSLYINGVRYRGNYSVEALEEAIAAALESVNQ